ncbi:hypothetical protein [Halomicrococcus sp. NG-SE-24]|uniref:hypothetical protein n=1 Tax=Halomicrococcus sp. NG-SE-24 TaxID=3436928 RepID=UPI003D953844
MKRDVLATLMVLMGALLGGTVPGLLLGAPMAVAGAFLLAEPRVKFMQVPDTVRNLDRLAR